MSGQLIFHPVVSLSCLCRVLSCLVVSCRVFVVSLSCLCRVFVFRFFFVSFLPFLSQPRKTRKTRKNEKDTKDIKYTNRGRMKQNTGRHKRHNRHLFFSTASTGDSRSMMLILMRIILRSKSTTMIQVSFFFIA